MYTMCEGRFHLKNKLVNDDKAALSWMCATNNDKPDKSINKHILFNKPRSGYMLHGSSAYLEDEYHQRCELNWDRRILDVGFDIKNYEQEIQSFLHFMSPMTEMIVDGRYCYEEDRDFSSLEIVDGSIEIVPGTKTTRYDRNV